MRSVAYAKKTRSKKLLLPPKLRKTGPQEGIQNASTVKRKGTSSLSAGHKAAATKEEGRRTQGQGIKDGKDTANVKEVWDKLKGELKESQRASWWT